MFYISRNDPAISYYEKFRAVILSEEMIIQNHLDCRKLFRNALENKNEQTVDIYNGNDVK